MSSKQRSPQNVKEQAVQIREAWSNIGADETYVGLTLDELVVNITSLGEIESTLQNLLDQLTQVRNQRKKQRYALWTLVKRIRAGARGKHGDDSNEYERFGGTRLSKRKRRRS